jgi:hypothetical protein
MKMDLVDIGWGGVNYIGLAQDRDKWRALENVVMNLYVPHNASTLSSGYTSGGPLSSAQLHIVREDEGHAVVEAVGFLPCWPRFDPCLGHVGFVVSLALVAGFLQRLKFLLPSIPLIAAHSSSSIIIWSWFSAVFLRSVLQLLCIYC